LLVALGLHCVSPEGANVDSGFYAACAGLRAQSQALEVSAHNLANLNTAGFRGQQTTFQSLIVGSRRGSNGLDSAANNVIGNVLNSATNNFGVLEGTHLDLTTGNLLTTGNPLDVGLEGSGFFAVQTTHGTRYTRNGSFQVSSSGQLVTAAGDPVLGANGAISVPAGAISIATDGTVSVEGAVVGSIQLAEFAAGTKLTSEGNALIAAPDGSAKPGQQSTVRQGVLESSNVNSITSVVALIGVQRQAEMLQRAMTLFDNEFNRIAATDLAKV
jgi:flagellar basal-body rod protein FlgF/flagellar basal-body rod protein FlgG